MDTVKPQKSSKVNITEKENAQKCLDIILNYSKNASKQKDYVAHPQTMLKDDLKRDFGCKTEHGQRINQQLIGKRIKREQSLQSIKSNEINEFINKYICSERVDECSKTNIITLNHNEFVRLKAGGLVYSRPRESSNDRNENDNTAPWSCPITMSYCPKKKKNINPSNIYHVGLNNNTPKKSEPMKGCGCNREINDENLNIKSEPTKLVDENLNRKAEPIKGCGCNREINDENLNIKSEPTKLFDENLNRKDEPIKSCGCNRDVMDENFSKKSSVKNCGCNRDIKDENLEKKSEPMKGCGCDKNITHDSLDRQEKSTRIDKGESRNTPVETEPAVRNLLNSFVTINDKNEMNDDVRILLNSILANTQKKDVREKNEPALRKRFLESMMSDARKKENSKIDELAEKRNAIESMVSDKRELKDPAVKNLLKSMMANTHKNETGQINDPALMNFLKSMVSDRHDNSEMINPANRLIHKSIASENDDSGEMKHISFANEPFDIVDDNVETSDTDVDNSASDENITPTRATKSKLTASEFDRIFNAEVKRRRGTASSSNLTHPSVKINPRTTTNIQLEPSSSVKNTLIHSAVAGIPNDILFNEDYELHNAIDKFIQADNACKFEEALKAAEIAAKLAPSGLEEEAAASAARNYQFQCDRKDNFNSILLDERKKPIEIVAYVGSTNTKK